LLVDVGYNGLGNSSKVIDDPLVDRREGIVDLEGIEGVFELFCCWHADHEERGVEQQWKSVMWKITIGAGKRVRGHAKRRD
jgi:hypothetical protein